MKLYQWKSILCHISNNMVENKTLEVEMHVDVEILEICNVVVVQNVLWVVVDRLVVKIV